MTGSRNPTQPSETENSELAALRRLAEQTPVALDTLVKLAFAELRHGSVENALSAASAALAKAPEDFGLRYLEARCHLRLGDPQRAAQLCQELLQQHSAKVGLHMTLAQAHLATDDYAAAISGLQAAVAAFPQDIPPRQLLSQVLFHHGAPADALNSIRCLVALKPDLILGHLWLTRCLKRLGRSEEAQDAAWSALQSDALRDHPDIQKRIELWTEALEASHQLQKFELLREQVLNLAKELPNEPAALSLVAKHLMAFNEAEGAVDLARSAFLANPTLAINPSFVQTMVQAGCALQALDDLESAGLPDDGSEKIILARATAMTHAGALARAFELLSDANRATLGRTKIMRRLLDLAVRLGHAQLACDLLEELSGLAPDAGMNLEQLRARSDLAFQDGDIATSLQFDREAQAAHPDRLDGLDRLGWKSIILGDYPSALEWQHKKHAVRSKLRSAAGQAPRNLIDQLDWIASEIQVLHAGGAGGAPEQTDIGTPRAITALGHLAQTGALFEMRDQEKITANPIPHTVFQYWHQPTPPDDIARLMARTKDLASGWDYQKFDKRTALSHLRSLGMPRVAHAMIHMRESQSEADLFQLAMLWAQGGLYLAINASLQADPLDLIPTGAEFVAGYETKGSLASGVLAASPRHPVISAALKMVLEAAASKSVEHPWLQTGSGMLTRAFAATAIDHHTQILPGIKILRPAQLNRVIGRDLLLYTHTVQAGWPTEMHEQIKTFRGGGSP